MDYEAYAMLVLGVQHYFLSTIKLNFYDGNTDKSSQR